MQVFGAAAVLLSLIAWPGGFSPQDLTLGAISGAGFAVGLCCYYLGLTRASSAIVAPLAAVLATLVPFGWAIMREVEISAVSLIGVVLALMGLVAVTADRQRRGVHHSWNQVGLTFGFRVRRRASCIARCRFDFRAYRYSWPTSHSSCLDASFGCLNEESDRCPARFQDCRRSRWNLRGWSEYRVLSRFTL